MQNETREVCISYTGKAIYFINFKTSEVSRFLGMNSAMKNLNASMSENIVTGICSADTTDL